MHSLVSGTNAVQNALNDLGIGRLIFQSLHLPTNDITFAFNANATSEGGEIFYNTADLSENAVGEGRMVLGDNFGEDTEIVGDAAEKATSGIVYSPKTFAVNTHRVGGTLIFLPLLHSAASPEVMVEILMLMETTLADMTPNLELMQSGGGWKGVGWCLWKKRSLLNTAVMDACFGCAVEGFRDEAKDDRDENKHFLLSDWDALRSLILNHQLWLNNNISTGGQDLLMHQLKVLNQLVDGGCNNASFNARGLYHVGIVEWGINVMLEAMTMDPPPSTPISASQFALGSDPSTPSFLLLSKTLLKHVLSNYLDKKKDLFMVAEVTLYTLTTGTTKGGETMDSSSMVRVYLLRLILELVTEGVDHLYASAVAPPISKRQSATGQITSLFKSKSKPVSNPRPGVNREAVVFISVFATTLTPMWFACILEGTSEEASASTALKLLLMLMQNSEGFRAKFKVAGGFETLIGSAPKFSTSPALLLPLMGYMLQISVRQIPTLPSLQGSQVVKLFDSIPSTPNTIVPDVSDEFGSLCSLISEVLGRNIQVSSSSDSKNEELKAAAQEANGAILHVMKTVIESDAESGRYEGFRRLTCTEGYIDPIVQALFVAADIIEKKHTKGGRVEGRRRGSVGIDITAGIEEEYVPNPVGLTGRKVSFHRRASATQTLMKRRASSTVSSGFLKINDDVGEAFAGNEGKDVLSVIKAVLTYAMKTDQAVETIKAFVKGFPAWATEEQVLVYYDILMGFLNSMLPTIASSVSYTMVLENLVEVGALLLTNVLQGLFDVDAVEDCLSFSIEVIRILTSTKTNRLLGMEAQNNLISKAVKIAQNMAVAVMGRGGYIRNALQLVNDNMKLLLVRSNVNSSGHNNRGKIVQDAANYVSSILKEDDGICDRAFVGRMTLEVIVVLKSEDSQARDLGADIIESLMKQRRQNVMELLGMGGELKGDEGSATGVGSNFVRDGFEMLTRGKKEEFWAWFSDNETHVTVAGELIRESIEKIVPTGTTDEPGIFIQRIQKEKVQAMGGKRVHSEIMFRGIERSERMGQAERNTVESHELWKRRGFDELTAGADRWRRLLRELKGEMGIWERGQVGAEKKGEKKEHWKLDLSEGPERMRMKMLRNWEFYEVYNVAEDEEGEEDRGHNLEKKNSGSIAGAACDGVQEMLEHEDVNVTARFVKEMQMRAGKKGGEAEEEEEEEGEDGGLSPDSERFGDEGEVEIEEEGEEEDEEEGGEGDESASVASSITEGDVRSKLPHSPRNRVDSELTEGDMEKPGGEDSGISPISESSAPLSDAVQMDDGRGATNFEMLAGLVQPNDLPDDIRMNRNGGRICYNVSRCTGLEVKKALLLFCKRAIYVIDGFQLSSNDIEGVIERVRVEESKFDVHLRRASSMEAGAVEKKDAVERVAKKGKDEGANGGSGVEERGDGDVTFQHRCKRIPFDEIFAVYKRRYQLRQIALEFFDSHRSSVLIAFDSVADRENLLAMVLKTPLPNSIFNSNKQMLQSGSSINYKKFMSNLRAKITNRWVNGRMTNFEYLMYLNTFAGRTYNDLTQYPVFPWVLSNYEDEEIDLSDERNYRDLGKPMGALGETRAEQFKERYEALSAYSGGPDDPPPFHYGTHYSCSGYVLYYLMRLEPYSRLALSLQGGNWDKPDRLFRSVASSWKSAAYENLQDVRELIPEFFYQPEFLSNTNYFDFGSTQGGVLVHDVELPKWAKGDPKKFVTINRMALESDVVSRNLRKWIDLVFGYKQRGREAVAAQNCFVHLTYEGNVDIDSLEDELEREATIAQIHNFGQTPSRLEKKPHVAKQVHSIRVKGKEDLDFGAISYLAPLTPPFCVVGAEHRVYLRRIGQDFCRMGMSGDGDASVGDLTMVKDKLAAVGSNCILLPPQCMKYIRFGGNCFGLSVHVSVTTPRHREVDKCVAIHDNLHLARITAVSATGSGGYIVTGCQDSSIRVWKASKNVHSRHISLKATLVGHDDEVSSIDIASSYGIIVSGGKDGRVCVWDLKRLCFIRYLVKGRKRGEEDHHRIGGGVKAVSVNVNNGNILCLVDGELLLFDINGKTIARQCTGGVGGGAGGGVGGVGGERGFKAPSFHRSTSASNFPLATTAISTYCPTWMTLGVVAVSGHANGDVYFWGVDWDAGAFVSLYFLQDKIHSCAITKLRVLGKCYFSGGGSGVGGVNVGGGVGGGGGREGGGTSGAVLGVVGVGGGSGMEDTLLVGDKQGRISINRVLRLDSLGGSDLSDIMESVDGRDGRLGGGMFGVFQEEARLESERGSVGETGL